MSFGLFEGYLRWTHLFLSRCGYTSEVEEELLGGESWKEKHSPRCPSVHESDIQRVESVCYSLHPTLVITTTDRQVCLTSKRKHSSKLAKIRHRPTPGFELADNPFGLHNRNSLPMKSPPFIECCQPPLSILKIMHTCGELMVQLWIRSTISRSRTPPVSIKLGRPY